jgi:hypothetical protein
MEPKFLDEICNVFMNKSEIKLNERIEGEKFKGIPNSQLEKDDTMQIFMKKLHEQRLKWRPHGRNSSTWVFFVSTMNYY